VTRLYTNDAELYDIAFDWDISDEADWLVSRLEATTVLEPGCGGGRMLEALAGRGCKVAGIDRSPRMVEIARRRLGTRADVFEADMTHFDLGTTFDGAVCPINTLLHLSGVELGRHLHLMARHLEPRARYLVQVGLAGQSRSRSPARTGRRAAATPVFVSTGSTRSSTSCRAARASGRGSRCCPGHALARSSKRCTR